MDMAVVLLILVALAWVGCDAAAHLVHGIRERRRVDRRMKGKYDG